MSDDKFFRQIGYINDGVVIDHISHGKAFDIIKILKLDTLKDFVVIASNFKSNKYGEKDLIKIKSKELTDTELNKIALLSKDATINVINDGQVIKKWKVNLPDNILNILKCNNPSCITNIEQIPTKFYVINKELLTVRCHYCEKTQTNIIIK
jgi:aspartate carbamoyltransferase regulatory subunit